MLERNYRLTLFSLLFSVASIVMLLLINNIYVYYIIIGAPLQILSVLMLAIVFAVASLALPAITYLPSGWI